MYQQPELLLEQYDIEVKAIQKGRGAFLVSTNLGPLLLQEYRGSVERAQILGEIWKTLKEHFYSHHMTMNFYLQLQIEL